MYRYVLTIALVAVLLVPTQDTVKADGCRSYSYTYDAGKTVEGFYASATDGCNTAKWTGSIGRGPGSGTVTFKTIDNRYPWQDGYTLPRYGDDEASCKARAAEEANGYFTNYFKAPLGTEVTVTYRCD